MAYPNWRPDWSEVPELSDLWASAQETNEVPLGEVEAVAKATGIPLEDLVEWLVSEGITVTRDEGEVPLTEERGEGAKVSEEEGEESLGPEELPSNPLQVLLRSLRYAHPLTPDEEVALAQRMERGDEKAREQLIESSIPLVITIARKFASRTTVPLEDLVQEGCLGLIKAVDRFDWRKGVRFTTYATWWIRHAIARVVAEQSRFIRIPYTILEVFVAVLRASRRLTQELKREPTPEEIAEDINLPPEQVKEVLQLTEEPLPLSVPVGEEEDTLLEDLIPDPNVASPEETFWRSLAKEHLQEILNLLSFREREVIKLRYGFVDGKIHTYNEIGQILKLSREAVRRIERRALQKLRDPRLRRLLERLNEMMS